jgi:uncharacterized protein YcsI (UPF0317 family)
MPSCVRYFCLCVWEKINTIRTAKSIEKNAGSILCKKEFSVICMPKNAEKDFSKFIKCKNEKATPVIDAWVSAAPKKTTLCDTTKTPKKEHTIPARILPRTA